MYRLHTLQNARVFFLENTYHMYIPGNNKMLAFAVLRRCCPAVEVGSAGGAAAAAAAAVSSARLASGSSRRGFKAGVF